MRNWSKRRSAQFKERSFGLRNSSGSLPVKITWLLVEEMLSRMRPWWSAIWIELIFSCIQSYTVQLFASSKTLQASQCPFSVSMRQPRLRCVIVLVGRIRLLLRCTGYTLIKYQRLHRQVCLSALVALSSVANATSWTHRDSNLASLSCSASAKNLWLTILVRDTAARMFMN